MIVFFGKPIAGSNFEYKIEGTRPGEQHFITAFVNHEEVYKRSTECYGPRCHEMFFIRRGLLSEHLSITYETNFGEKEEFDFIIQAR